MGEPMPFREGDQVDFRIKMTELLSEERAKRYNNLIRTIEFGGEHYMLKTYHSMIVEGIELPEEIKKNKDFYYNMSERVKALMAEVGLTAEDGKRSEEIRLQKMMRGKGIVSEDDYNFMVSFLDKIEEIYQNLLKDYTEEQILQQE